MAELLTQNAYAKRRGVTHRAVQKAIESKRLSRSLKPQANGRVLIDPVLADKEWAANTDTSKPSNTVVPRTPAAPVGEAMVAPEVGPAGPSLVQSRAIREAYQARLAKLEFEERSGKLVNADEVRVAAFNAARKARDMLLSIPDRLAPVLAGLSDAYECHRVMSDEIKRVCEQLSDVRENGSGS